MLSEQPRPAPELGWGIVGTGTISQLIAADLSAVPRARLRAVCSRDPARAAGFATASGAEVFYSDRRMLLADPDVDIVYIATPHATHEEWAIAALDAGKHVLIEKPIAVDAAQASHVAQAAERSGRFAMEAMWMRFNPAYRAALGLIAGGRIGDARSVRASFGLPFDAPDSSRWSAERASSTMLDQGIYAVTVATDVLGVPDRVHATGRSRGDGVDLTAHLEFEYDDGRFAQLSASMIEYIEPTASISGTQGWITLAAPFWGTRSFEVRAGGIPQTLSSAEQHPFDVAGFGYVPMLDAVHGAIGGGLVQHPWHPLDDTIRTLTILDGIRRRISEIALEEHR